jgi:hypothetical protein
MMRAVALAVLVLWTGALVACSAHCFLGTSHLGLSEKRPSCHAAPPPCHGGPHDDDGQSDSGALCTTLKQMSVQQTASEVPHQNVFVLYFLPFNQADSSGHVANALEYRQSFPVEWLVTPEVSLGVIHLPHGPPIVM